MVAANRVVMNTLCVRLGVTHGPTLLISGTIPQAYLLLMSLIRNNKNVDQRCIEFKETKNSERFQNLKIL